MKLSNVDDQAHHSKGLIYSRKRQVVG